LDFGSGAQTTVAETLAGLSSLDQAAAERLAAQVADRLHGCGLSVTTEIREGRPSQVILERAAALPADLIVIGAKGLSAPGEFRLGSTAYKLVHYAECSVLVARPPEWTQPPLCTILAADGSLEAQRAAEFLCALSLPQWSEVGVVGVAEATVGIPSGSYPAERRPAAGVPEVVRRALLDAAEARVTEVVERLHDCGGQVWSAVRLGHPAEEILATAQAQDADLIVVGARGQTRAEPFRLGGVAQKVVKYASCSVLVVR
jgi:nucleotide-binding universal stress UspA family protein